MTGLRHALTPHSHDTADKVDSALESSRAGIVIVATIAASAAFAGYEAVRRLLQPQDLTHLGYVAAAGRAGSATGCTRRRRSPSVPGCP